MDCPEDGDALRLRQQARSPGDGLVGCALVIGITAVAFPAANRQQEVDAGLVGHLSQPNVVFPAPGPALWGLVTKRPEEQLTPKKPSFSRFALYIAIRPGI